MISPERLIDLTKEGYWHPPVDELTIDIPNPYFLDPPANCWKLCVVLSYWRRQVATYSIELSTRTEASWAVVWRSDTSEGQIHRHAFSPNGNQRRKILRPILSQKDVIDGSEEEYDYIVDHFESEQRRWESARI